MGMWPPVHNIQVFLFEMLTVRRSGQERRVFGENYFKLAQNTHPPISQQNFGNKECQSIFITADITYLGY